MNTLLVVQLTPIDGSPASCPPAVVDPAAGVMQFDGGVGGGGIEFPLMWGLILLAVALRGGGPYSLDRKIGVEV